MTEPQVDQSTSTLRFGVMQGRLLPKYEGRYQAHPVGYWAEEFGIAAQEGLDYIEFILDQEGWANNPLMTSQGLAQITEVSRQSGVGVDAICADYFLERPLWDYPEGADVLTRVLDAGAALGAEAVVLPVLEKATIPSDEAARVLAKTLSARLGPSHPLIALELECGPEEVLHLLGIMDNSRVGVAYDSGNLAANGHQARSDWEVYGHRVVHVHLKDRHRGSGSVPLGEGGVDFPGLFEWMRRVDYSGGATLQGFRDEDGPGSFRPQWQFVKSLQSALPVQ